MSDERKMAKMALVLLSKWGLTYQNQCDLLKVALVPSPGDDAFDSFSIEIYSTALRLLEIHALLRTLFPKNLGLAYDWVTRKNRAFEASPIDLIMQGASGIDRVLDYLHSNVH